jgi:tetraacyldisaccharide 4'-kinase
VHLLDDGFQHLQLARDLDLVIVGPGDVNGRAMPFGRLREPAAALSAADAILLDDESVDGARSKASIPTRPYSGSGDRSTIPLRSIRCRVSSGPRICRGSPWHARPERFSRALAQAGWTVIETLTFPDHHRYTWRDVRQIQDVAERTRATVLTTTKDAMRLLPLRPLPVTVAAVPLQVSIEPGDVFRRWLFDRLRQIRS